LYLIETDVCEVGNTNGLGRSKGSGVVVMPDGQGAKKWSDSIKPGRAKTHSRRKKAKRMMKKRERAKRKGEEVETRIRL